MPITGNLNPGNFDIVAFLGVGGYAEFKLAIKDVDANVRELAQTTGKILTGAMAAGPPCALPCMSLDFDPKRYP